MTEKEYLSTSSVTTTTTTTCNSGDETRDRKNDTNGGLETGHNPTAENKESKPNDDKHDKEMIKEYV